MLKLLIRPFGRRWVCSLFCLVLMLGGGCQTTLEPFTNRRQFIIMSPEAEMRMSSESWAAILSEEKPSTNKARIAAVARVGQRVSAVVDKDGFEWEFKVFAGDTANAFCLPGGKVGVYDGLFKHIANDAELATVVSHEIAHAVARHGGERMTQALLLELGAAGLAIAMKDETQEKRERWLAAYTGVGMVGLMLPYSRTHEYSADRIGVMYMAQAGYHPQAALDFWEKFAAADKSAGIPEFFSTHPVEEKRIARLRQLLPDTKLEYEVAPERLGFGEDLSGI